MTYSDFSRTKHTIVVVHLVKQADGEIGDYNVEREELNYDLLSDIK